MPVNTKKYVDKYKIWDTNNLTNQKYKVQIFWEIQIKLMPTDTKNILTNTNKRIQIILTNTNKVDARKYNNFVWQIQIMKYNILINTNKNYKYFEKYK